MMLHLINPRTTNKSSNLWLELYIIFLFPVVHIAASVHHENKLDNCYVDKFK